MEDHADTRTMQLTAFNVPKLGQRSHEYGSFSSISKNFVVRAMDEALAQTAGRENIQMK